MCCRTRRNSARKIPSGAWMGFTAYGRSFRQLEPPLLGGGMLPGQDQDVPDEPDGFGAELRLDLPRQLLLFLLGSRGLDLDQLVRVEREVDLAPRPFRPAVAADPHHRLQAVSLSPEPF